MKHSTGGTITYVAAIACLAGAVALCAVVDLRTGIYVLAALLGVAALIRATGWPVQVSSLVVRARWFDTSILLLAGAALIVLVQGIPLDA